MDGSGKDEPKSPRDRADHTRQRDTLGFLIQDTNHLFHRAFRRRLESVGVTAAQSRALMMLSAQEGENQAALAGELDIQPITLARLIDKLEAMGLVERRPDATDRRTNRLWLTRKGRRKVEEICDLGMNFSADITAAIPRAELRAYIRTTAQIHDTLSEIDAAEATGGARKPARSKRQTEPLWWRK